MDTKTKQHAAGAKIDPKPICIGIHGTMGSGKDTVAAMLVEHFARDNIHAVRYSFAAPLREAVCVLTAGAVTNTLTTVEKGTLIPDGALGRTLGELKTRICWALSYALGVPVKEGGLVSHKTLVKAASALTGAKFPEDQTETAAAPPDTAFETPRITAGRLLQLFGTDVAVDLISPTIWVDNVQTRIEPCSAAIFTDVRFAHEAKFIKELGGKMVGIVTPRAGAEFAAGRDKKHKSEIPLSTSLDYYLGGGGSLEELRTMVKWLYSMIKSDISKNK